MKKTSLLVLAIFICTGIFAKKVKFAVDMTGQTVSSLGVHVVGDFQVAAGYALDWDPTLTTLSQEGSTSIYSIVVNIPAFQKYEYRFANGNQTYDSEFVPEESRVGYNFDDNRWLYVDSLKNDTTFVGAILFAGNAPSGLNLIRYKVDMSSLIISSFGAHVLTTDNGFSPVKTRLYSFGDGIYEIINYQSTGSYSFLYNNGKTLSDAESVPSSCSTAGNRTINLNKDSVLPVVCFGACSSCILASVKDNAKKTAVFNLFPNPAGQQLTISSASGDMIKNVVFYNASWQKIQTIDEVNQSSCSISSLPLSKGLYFAKITSTANSSQYIKLIVE